MGAFAPFLVQSIYCIPSAGPMNFHETNDVWKMLLCTYANVMSRSSSAHKNSLGSSLLCICIKTLCILSMYVLTSSPIFHENDVMVHRCKKDMVSVLRNVCGVARKLHIYYCWSFSHKTWINSIISLVKFDFGSRRCHRYGIVRINIINNNDRLMKWMQNCDWNEWIFFFLKYLTRHLTPAWLLHSRYNYSTYFNLVNIELFFKSKNSFGERCARCFKIGFFSIYLFFITCLFVLFTLFSPFFRSTTPNFFFHES